MIDIWKAIPLMVALIGGVIQWRLNRTNNKLQEELAKLKIQSQRKENLSHRQRAVLFILQNMLNNAIADDSGIDIDKKISYMMNEIEDFQQYFNPKVFNSPINAFYSEIALSTCSSKVMALRLLIQEMD